MRHRRWQQRRDERRGGERRATRRATDAMRHKTARAYMYGYATHIKPQGYTSRPPLLTTNKVFLPKKIEDSCGAGGKPYSSISIRLPTRSRDRNHNCVSVNASARSPHSVESVNLEPSLLLQQGSSRLARLLAHALENTRPAAPRARASTTRCWLANLSHHTSTP